jgi:hypothetical protein
MKKELKGQVSILINREYTTIEIHDDEANIKFATIELTPEQLSMCLSRQASVNCKLIVRGLEKVGKKHENKSFEFILPKWYANRDDRVRLAEYAQSLLSNGWIADAYFGSQDSFFMKDRVGYGRCTIRRWI